MMNNARPTTGRIKLVIIRTAVYADPSPVSRISFETAVNELIEERRIKDPMATRTIANVLLIAIFQLSRGITFK